MGVKQDEVKRLNTSLIIDTIKNMKTSTRAEIVEATKISHTTVRTILKELIDREEVFITGLDESSGGRRAERYMINTNKRLLLIIAIEKNKIAYKVINIFDEILEESSSSFNDLYYESELLLLVENILIANNNIKAIVISVPGIVTDNGYISGLGISDWKEIKIKECLKKKFHIPIVLENDLNAISLGFYNDYKEKQNSSDFNMVYINFTTLGAGAGIIINGNLLRGKDNCSLIGILPIKESYLNDYILKDIDNQKYIEIIIDTLNIITSILNPNLIIIGGNNFKYDLAPTIINKYNDVSNILATILINEDSKEYEFAGLSKIGFSLI